MEIGFQEGAGFKSRYIQIFICFSQKVFLVFFKFILLEKTFFIINFRIHLAKKWLLQYFFSCLFYMMLIKIFNKKTILKLHEQKNKKSLNFLLMYTI